MTPEPTWSATAPAWLLNLTASSIMVDRWIDPSELGHRQFLEYLGLREGLDVGPATTRNLRSSVKEILGFLEYRKMKRMVQTDERQ